MDAVTTILTLLAAVVASSVIARAVAPLFPLPLPFIQIALGGIIGAAVPRHIAIEPELFLLIFIAPLLFLDGWRIPKEGLLDDRWAIGALALGLVLFTVLGAGFFIHWMIPVMPLPVAFALAAILSPTDAVAVTAIARRSPVPRRLLHLLEGEALLNDASGLVCMRFAVAAALTGTFSLLEASGTFLWLAVGGCAVGAAVALAANTAKDWVARHLGEETGSQILISLLIPFAAYLLATRIQASGILAAVAAGIAMNHEERTGRGSPVTRIRRAAVWDALQFAANGVIFVLLGQQFPAIAAGAEQVMQKGSHGQGLQLLLYILAINAALLALRGVWVWITMRLLLPPGQRQDGKPGWRLAAAATLAGARGALTLSGVMTLPVALADGAPFPARDLAIILATGVIVASLLTANAGLPLLLRHAAAAPRDRDEEDAARLSAARSAIRALEDSLEAIPETRADAALYRQAAAHVIERYRKRMQMEAKAGAGIEAARQLEGIERGMRIVALRAERDDYFRSARSGRLTDERARLLIREIDLLEAHLAGR